MARRNGTIPIGRRGFLTASDGSIAKPARSRGRARSRPKRRRDGAEHEALARTEVNSVINLVIDHFQAGDRQQTDSLRSNRRIDARAGRLVPMEVRDAFAGGAGGADLIAAGCARTSRTGRLTTALASTWPTLHRLLARIAMAEGDPAAAEAEGLRYPDPAGLPGALSGLEERTSRWAGCKRNSAAGKRRGRPLPKRLR